MDLEGETFPHESRESWVSANKTKLIIAGLAILVILILVTVVSFAIFAGESSDMDSMSGMDSMSDMDDMDDTATETASATVSASASPSPILSTQKRPNIIFMISDGFSPSSETFARTMNPDQPLLELDSMIVGTSRTYSSMSLITDSAAGATAYACGQKTYNGAIAVDPEEKPIATAMEAAKYQGMTTAIVTTSRITHATPASFSSHITWRDLEEEIALQQATLQKVDLLFGGGLQMYTEREDGLNLLQTMHDDSGYQTITTYDEFLGPLQMPVIGLFAEEHMDFELDRIRENPPSQPSLPEMVTRALGLLKENDNPFFLMIEGARIDMAGHNHDAYAHYLEIMQYQDSVAIVKKFVQENPNTYVVSVADHATGGISLGSSFYNGTYPDPYMWYPDNLKNQTASVEWISEYLHQQNDVALLNATVAEYCGIELSDKEYELIMHAYNNPNWGDQWKALRTVLGSVVSSRALVAWTTPGHVGVDVNLYSYGKRAEGFGGVMNNIDVGNFIWKEMGFLDDMATITAQLQDMILPPYPPAKAKFAGKGAYFGHN